MTQLGALPPMRNVVERPVTGTHVSSTLSVVPLSGLTKSIDGALQLCTVTGVARTDEAAGSLGGAAPFPTEAETPYPRPAVTIASTNSRLAGNPVNLDIAPPLGPYEDLTGNKTPTRRLFFQNVRAKACPRVTVRGRFAASLPASCGRRLAR